MSTVKSYILRSMDFRKTQKSRYLENTTFFLQIKKMINYASKVTLWQKNCFVAKVTFNPKFLNFNAEAVARRCSVKKVFLEISQN